MAAFGDVDLVDVRITTRRLELRPWRRDDAPAVAEIMADSSWRPHLDLPARYTPHDAEQFVTEIAPAARVRRTELTCALVAGDLLVGSAGIAPHDESGRSAHIGYWIAPSAHRRGYASEATIALAEWGYAHGVHRIEITMDPRNIASARVAMRAGFAFEAIRTGDYWFAGEPRDSAVFVRTALDDGAAIAPAFAPLPDGGLRDDAIEVRIAGPDDADAFAEQENDPLTVARGFTGTERPRAAIDRILARTALDHLTGTATGFSIVDLATGRVAGGLRLRANGPPGVGGVGYVVHPDFRGRGYAARALRLVSRWAFERAGFARLELGAKVDNVASQRAALAAGFSAEGVWRSRLRAPDGTFADEARFALIAPR